MAKAGGGGDVEPATSAAGGMCDRFLTFLAKNLSVSRMKSIAEGPRSGAGAGGHPLPTEGGDDGVVGVEDDEFAIPIERAEFDFQLNGHGDGGHSSGVATTILEESAATTTTMGVPEQKQDGAAATAAAADDGPVASEAAAPAVAQVVEETKVRRTVTIKEDRPAQEGGSGGASAMVERKKSLFRKRQASSVVGAGEEQGGASRVPRRSGLRPRMPQVARVPSNINERSSSFVEERKKGFGGKPAPEK